MYESMYHTLFSAITNAMEMIEWQECQGALFCLEKACLDAEEIYMSQGPDQDVKKTKDPLDEFLDTLECPQCGYKIAEYWHSIVNNRNKA